MSTKSILEDKFKDRIKVIKDLIESTKEKTERIKYDKELRDSYTNKSVRENFEIYNMDSDKYKKDLLEAEDNLQKEYKKYIFEKCVFSEDEIKYIINNHKNMLSFNNCLWMCPILCDIDNITHVLKYCGDDKNITDIGFFFTRFIIEDNIISLFNNGFIYYENLHKNVYLKVSD